MKLVTKCGINLKLGIVQTAYANGASTDYIQKTLVRFNKLYIFSLVHFIYSILLTRFSTESSSCMCADWR